MAGGVNPRIRTVLEYGHTIAQVLMPREKW